MSQNKVAAIVILCLSCCPAIAGTNDAQLSPSEQLDQVTNLRANASAGDEIPKTREIVLRGAAQILGAQTGYAERSAEILSDVKKKSLDLDRRFSFGALMLGVGVLPPVITQANDVVNVQATTMHVAGRLYRILEPAHFVSVAPSWRDWLLLGLDAKPRLNLQGDASQLPNNAAESAFWKSAVKEAYDKGRAQASAAFTLNLALLERTYTGMRNFYELYQRGMVTMPSISSHDSIVEKPDENTIVVGDMVFRITKPAQLVNKYSQWVPLGD
jgi:defect in organelle trafficking protein DotC